MKIEAVTDDDMVKQLRDPKKNLARYSKICAEQIVVVETSNKIGTATVTKYSVPDTISYGRKVHRTT